MYLPRHLQDKNEWVFVGPMGPNLPTSFSTLPSVGVDGGAAFLSPLTIWVGDHDSLEGEHEALHNYPLPKNKDKSDLAAALDLFIEGHHYKFHFWGFLGGRRDHELFNIGEVLNFLERHDECEVLFYNEEGKVMFHLLSTGHWKFHHVGIFSLGTLKKTQVKLTGQCQYPIPRTKIIFPLTSFGLSNIGEGDIVIETDGPLFLYFPEGK